jgi:hypothetical protein
MATIDEMCPPEPFAQLMKEQGKPHTDGWLMFVPAQLFKQYGPMPRYVIPSKLIKPSEILFGKIGLGDGAKDPNQAFGCTPVAKVYL